MSVLASHYEKGEPSLVEHLPEPVYRELSGHRHAVELLDLKIELGLYELLKQ